MSDTIFLQIFDMTKVASLVILIVLLVRLCLKRAPKVFSYALWAVVLFRLLCPVSIEAPISLIPQPEPTIQNYDLLNEPVTPLAAIDAAQQAVGDVLNGGIGVQHVYTTNYLEDGTRRIISTDWSTVWILFTKFLWLGGMAALLIYSTVSLIRLKRKLVGAILLRDNIYLADHIDSPFVMGLFRPKIYLPSSLSEKERDYIILHEQHHIRRGDHLVKLLSFAALCLHCFNPLVWIAFILSGKDMEMSCDEAVLRNLGGDIRADYTASLISLATGRRIIAGTPLAFGEGNTEGRIKNIAKWKKPAVWVIVVASVVCIAAVLCLGTNIKMTPYSWTSVITAKNIADSSVFAYGETMYQAMLTEAQKEELARCLRNIQKPSMRTEKQTESTQKSLLVSILLPHEDGEKKIPLFYDGNTVMQLPVRTSELKITSTWYFDTPELLSFFEKLEKSIRNGQGLKIGNNSSNNLADMVPTTANITGAFDGYLYVPIDGANYRYERIYDDPSSVTKGHLMHRFTEEADPSNVEWRVYAVDDYPDRSVVLAEAGDDYVQLYRYSPSKAVDPSRLIAAKASGMITLEDGYATYEQKLWTSFYLRTQDGESASVKIAHYHTLEYGNYSEEYYEVYKEDYPSLYEFDLSYDGKMYTLKWNEYGTEYERQFKYLRKFEDVLPTQQSFKEPQMVTRYVLTNNNTASWDELWRSLASSQLGDFIDHYTIYSEKN